MYALSVSPAYVRHALRQRFERQRHVTDSRAIDVLLLKGRQDYQETMNCWKQTDHVVGILLQPQDRPQRTFLQKFYEGECPTAVFACCLSELMWSQARTRRQLSPQRVVFRYVHTSNRISAILEKRMHAPLFCAGLHTLSF